MAVMSDFNRTISAPPELGVETRSAFREAAFGELSRLPEQGTLNIDLEETRRVDSAGLSALLLVQRRAAERSQRVVLRNLSDELRYLLALTEMAELFDTGG